MTPAQIASAVERNASHLPMAWQIAIQQAVETMTAPQPPDRMSRRAAALVAYMSERPGRVVTGVDLVRAGVTRAKCAGTAISKIKKEQPQLRDRIRNVAGQGWMWID